MVSDHHRIMIYSYKGNLIDDLLCDKLDLYVVAMKVYCADTLQDNYVGQQTPKEYYSLYK